jgi:hypothetical protein
MKAMTKFVEGTRQYVNIQCDDEIVRDFGSTPLIVAFFGVGWAGKLCVKAGQTKGRESS